jgi:hypothetical protein
MLAYGYSSDSNVRKLVGNVSPLENLNAGNSVVIVQVDVDAELVIQGDGFALFDAYYFLIDQIQRARRNDMQIGRVGEFIVRPARDGDFAQLIDYVTTADADERPRKVAHHLG